MDKSFLKLSKVGYYIFIGNHTKKKTIYIAYLNSLCKINRPSPHTLDFPNMHMKRFASKRYG